jgi:CRISPR-associated protein Csx10
MMLTLTFRLKLNADYHVGSGHGAGPTVDAALLRDQDRAPLLRGSILAGLLRDGLRDLFDLPLVQDIAKAERKKAALKEAEDRLFGSVARRKQWAYASARIENGGGGRTAGRWGAQDVTRIRVSPRTRRTVPQKLFKEEEGDARASFTFTATCPHPMAQDENDAALLIAASRMVRHLGATRRRGRGECEILLEKASGLPSGAEWTQDEALEVFKVRWLNDAYTLTVSPPTEQAPPPLDGPRVCFRIVARIDEPVIVTRRSEAGNSYESLSFVPGTSLLGAIANRAAKKLGLNPDDTAPEEFVAFFFRGGVRVTGLLPAEIDKNGVHLSPAIHAPLDLFACDDYPYSHPFKSFALKTELPDKCEKCAAEKRVSDLIPAVKLKRMLKLQRHPEPFEPHRREEAHIQMNSETGRARTGGLYEYIALEAGQWLTGEIECANEACWKRLQELIGVAEGQTLKLRLGKASQRGYGLVTCSLMRIGDPAASVNQSVATSPWVLRPLAQRVLSTTEPFSLLLLTDAIITDEWGRYEQGFTRQWVAEILKLTPDQITLMEGYAEARIVDTFNAARRAPRWRDEAIIAGSAVGIEILPDGLQSLVADWCKSHPDSTAIDELTALRWRLEQIEAEGIGLRTMEGFGRLAFNHPIYTPLSDGCLDVGVEIPALKEFQATPPTGRLVAEALFRREYEEYLIDCEQEAQKDQSRRLGWEALGLASFEAVARLLFLSRASDAETIKDELKKLAEIKEVEQLPNYLWNKSLPGRGKEPKLDKQGVELICRLIDELKKNVEGAVDQRWAIGLEILAARVAELAHKGVKR